MDFGTRNVNYVTAPTGAGVPDIISTRLTVQQALFGVNYKFNWGGPVIAKY